MHCFACRMFGSPGTSEENRISKGVRAANWKNAKKNGSMTIHFPNIITMALPHAKGCLEYSPRTNALYCFACRMFGSPGTSEENRISKGVRAANWKTPPPPKKMDS